MATASSWFTRDYDEQSLHQRTRNVQYLQINLIGDRLQSQDVDKRTWTTLTTSQVLNQISTDNSFQEYSGKEKLHSDWRLQSQRNRWAKHPLLPRTRTTGKRAPTVEEPQVQTRSKKATTSHNTRHQRQTLHSRCREWRTGLVGEQRSKMDQTPSTTTTTSPSYRLPWHPPSTLEQHTPSTVKPFLFEMGIHH